MESDDAKSAAFIQSFRNIIDGLLQHIQFAVYFDTDGLECSFCRMGAVFSGTLRHCLFDDIYQFARCFDRAVFSFFYDELCDSSCPAFFAVSKDDSVQFVFVIFIDHIVCAEGLVRIHTHIQWCILLIGKTAFRFIQLMRGNTDIQ